MTPACRNVAPKTKHKRKDAVANERFKKNMWKIKWSKTNRFYRHNLKPCYSYSCSFRDLGDFWTEIARRTCDKEALDGVLDRLFWVFVISELRELGKSSTNFQDSISPTIIVFFRFEALSTHARVQKRPLNDVVKWVVCSTNAFLRFFCNFEGHFEKHVLLMRRLLEKRHAAQATATCFQIRRPKREDFAERGTPQNR